MLFRGFIALLLCASLVAQTTPVTPDGKAAPVSKKPAARTLTIPERIAANEKEIGKLSPLVKDPDYAQDGIKEVIARKLIALRCENKVLQLESLLGTQNVTEADRKTVRTRCTEREQREILGEVQPEIPPRPLEARDTSDLPGFCTLPEMVPAKGKPVSMGAAAQPNDAEKPTQYDAWVVKTTKDSGTQVVGQHTVQVQYFNILRYSYAIGANVTFTDGPSIPSAFGLGVASFPAMTGIPASTGDGGKPQTGAASGTKFGVLSVPPTIPPPGPDPVAVFQKKWKKYENCFENIRQRVSAIDQAINNAATVTQIAASNINNVLNANPAKIVADFNALRAGADDSKVFGQFYTFTWPTMQIGVLQNLASRLSDESANLRTDKDYAAWYAAGGNKDAFDFVKTQTDRMIEHLTALSPTSDAAGKLQAAQDSVRVWRSHFNTVAQTGRDGFIPSYDVACDAWFGKGKTTAVKLSTRDRLNPTAGEESADLISVICNPPLTISTGIGFSLIRERVPGFIPGIKRDASGNPVLDAGGNPVIIDKLGYTSESRAKPIYALQINGSIKEFDSGFGLHGSLGAAVGGSNDTSNMEFLAGLSGSFLRRAFFVTPAFHLGRRLDFLADFKAGDPRGNLSSPPTKMQWKPGFAVTITFPVTK
jgi:hypothetical protein